MRWWLDREAGGASALIEATRQAWQVVGRSARYVYRLHPLQKFLTIVLLFGVLVIPLLGTISAYQDYQQLRSLGLDAVHHLLAAKDAIIPPTSSAGSATCSTATPQPTATAKGTATKGTATASPKPTPVATPSSGSASPLGGLSTLTIPSTAQLSTAQSELHIAQTEFRQLGNLLDQPGPTLAIAGKSPVISSKISDVRQLVYVGDDASTVGLNLVTAVEPLLARLHSGVLSSSTEPLITPAEEAQIKSALASSTGMLDDIEQRVAQLDVTQLPLSACQRAEFVSLTSKLPEVRDLLAQAPTYFDMLMWFAGVDQQRQFLVQTMDPAELRPTGGFTGDFGVLTIKGGRVQPFALRDVDSVYLNTPFSLRPPAVYDWWPFPRWGLRDSNVSPDWPTTARINMDLYQNAQHIWKTIGMPNNSLDGVIALTPAPIAHVLLVTGPLTVPKYNEVITADNLESKLNYYQQDPAAIARQQALSPDVPTTPRKRFTYVVAQLLETRVRQMSLSQLTSLAKIMLQDMQNHELQVYVTNPQIENMLVQHDYATHVTAAPGQDSLMINQANVSVSKASAFVTTNVQDNITLDTHGGAEHNLTITIANNGKGPYYGYTTYLDYVRVYVPKQAQLQFGNGFDTGQPVCWVAPPWHPTEKAPDRFKSLPPCPANGFYKDGTRFFGDGSLQCPAGYWGPGPRPSNVFGGDGKTDFPVDNTGYPTNYTSDLSGFGMFGGYVTIPELCTGVITLQYYVPNVALPSKAVPANSPAYSLAITRQAGTALQMAIRVQPAGHVSGETTKPVQLQGALSADTTLDVPRAGG